MSLIGTDSETFVILQQMFRDQMMGIPVSFSPLTGGIVNKVYEVKTNDGRSYVIRVQWNSIKQDVFRAKLLNPLKAITWCYQEQKLSAYDRLKPLVLSFLSKLLGCNNPEVLALRF